MSVAELISSIQFVVDAEGNKKAAVLDWPVWEEVVAALEKLAVLETSLGEELADDQQWDAAFTHSQDVLARLADEARAEREAGRTQRLDSDSL